METLNASLAAGDPLQPVQDLGTPPEVATAAAPGLSEVASLTDSEEHQVHYISTCCSVVNSHYDPALLHYTMHVIARRDAEFVLTNMQSQLGQGFGSIQVYAELTDMLVGPCKHTSCMKDTV